MCEEKGIKSYERLGDSSIDSTLIISEAKKISELFKTREDREKALKKCTKTKCRHPTLHSYFKSTKN